MLRVAIFFKHEIELLSLYKEFRMKPPSYNLTIIVTFALGFGKRIEVELPRRAWFKISLSIVNNSLIKLGSMLFIAL